MLGLPSPFVNTHPHPTSPSLSLLRTTHGQSLSHSVVKTEWTDPAQNTLVLDHGRLCLLIQATPKRQSVSQSHLHLQLQTSSVTAACLPAPASRHVQPQQTHIANHRQLQDISKHAAITSSPRGVRPPRRLLRPRSQVWQRQCLLRG